MRVVVYPHVMEIGGSQMNAIQLAGAVRDRGHDVIVAAAAGPLVKMVRDLNLEYVAVPSDKRRPSPAMMNWLTRLVVERSIDIVHGYEWPPAVEAFYGPGLRLGTAVMGTILSQSVVPFFPKPIPLLVGTEQLVHAARAAGHDQVNLMEPPVDTEHDRPGIDKRAADEFRARYAADPTLPLAVMVCRLVPVLKRESLLAACGAIEELARSRTPTQLAIVGDGPIRNELAARAEQVNMQAGRQLIVLTGELSDPRPAYDAADVVLGMGGSALRALAFAKPLIVVGECGFSELLTTRTAPLFLANGWYGLGAGSLGEGVTGMSRSLSIVLGNTALRAELGEFGRNLVLNRFSLFAAAKRQEEEYEGAIAKRLSSSQLAAAATSTLVGIIDYKVRRKISRWRGTIVVDDANAVAALHRRQAVNQSN